MACFYMVFALVLLAIVGADVSFGHDAVKMATASQLRLYGQGNCKPNRPQWELCNGADFHSCQQACLSSEKCIGFDYDPAYDGCCRVRLNSNHELEKGMPKGFNAIRGESGDGFTGTAGSKTAFCYERPNHKYDMAKYGKGNCAPARPQRHGYTTFAQCQGACIDDEYCIGLDYDTKWQYCRMRFRTLQDASRNRYQRGLAQSGGLIIADGQEGPGFGGTDGSSTATCYVKTDYPFSDSYDLLIYGSGNCQPERPQWESCNGTDFHTCQQTCTRNHQCIGFDYDAAYGGCCRIRFSSNSDMEASLRPWQFKALSGEEGPGFTGSSGPASATCYVKPNHPSSAAFDLFIYGPGNCQPSRPQWRLGNPATFGICQQTCLKTDDCMGFDYDPAYGGYCRLRFATNEQAESRLLGSKSDSDAGFVFEGSVEEGYGFSDSSGRHGNEAATCYVKPAFPSSASANIYASMFFPMLSVMFVSVTLIAVVVKITRARRSNSITAPLLNLGNKGAVSDQDVDA